MKTINTADATGAALDWLVWKCAGGIDAYPKTGSGSAFLKLWKGNSAKYVHPSTDWSQGGPIIERGNIALWPDAEEGGYFASVNEGRGPDSTGETPLIAAMRCFVASKLGDTAKVPEELCP